METNSSFRSNVTNGADHVDMLPILLPAIAIGICISALNIFTICIILLSKRLRRPTNYPIVSVLLGATLQGMLTAPTYVFKRLDEKQHQEHWLCDFYRLPYFLCGHILKMSLMLVSFDRLVATKYPYRYPYVVTKKIVTIVLCLTWFTVVIIDLIPFLPFGKIPDDEGCTYTPKRAWGIIVITMFNILPFVIIAINYLIIWRVAVRITFKEFQLKQSLHSSHMSCKDSHEHSSNECSIPSLNNRESYTDNNLITSDISIIDANNESGKQEVTNNVLSTVMLCICTEKDKTVEKGIDASSRKNSQETMVNERKKNKKHRWEKTSSKMLRLAWELKATKTSLMLLMVYLLCWGPLGILYMIDNYCLNCISDNTNRSLDRFIVKVVSFLSSLFLPLVYCWRTKEFRTETCRIVCKNRYRKKKSKKFFKGEL